jgi:hypothetical protein
MSAGIALGAGILCYMAWGLTHRKPGEKLSVYLIHTRLGVQVSNVIKLFESMSRLESNSTSLSIMFIIATKHLI